MVWPRIEPGTSYSAYKEIATELNDKLFHKYKCKNYSSFNRKNNITVVKKKLNKV